MIPKIYLKRKKEESLERRHPWVFSGAIERAEGDPVEGRIVDVFTSDGKFAARGHCQIGSIAVRVLTFRQEEIDAEWWTRRIAEAYELRRALGFGTQGIGTHESGLRGTGRDRIDAHGIDAQEAPTHGICAHEAGTHAADAHEPDTREIDAEKMSVHGVDKHGFDARELDLQKVVARGAAEIPHTTCYRLIHGEGDNLPGLIVDIYDRTAVVQCHSVGMYESRAEITSALCSVLGDGLDAVYDKSAQTLPFNAGLDPIDGYLFGSASVPATTFENGNKFLVNWEKGQKTGFFIDQRENRELVGKYAAGRKVLNTFCYTGGFSVYALAGGAAAVDSVDSSEYAVELAARNVEFNFGGNAPHRAIAADAMDFIRDMDDSYDMIILDPPAFAKHHKVLGNAMQGYRRLNARAIQKIRSGGILFTFSCSQAVSRELFRTTIFSAAAIAGRKVRILHQLTQPADHPVNIYHPEGEYLKGLVLYVE